jgi:catechol 2,3-dioxygenase-like lactoylglutathione lyase family enzyme
MKPYVEPHEQLIVEIFVRDIRQSREFLQRFGFELVRDEGDFIELRWEQHLIFLEAIPNLPAPPSFPVANIRVMVPDVDAYLAKASAAGARVIKPIGDRYYGLRDFTVAGPDGIALRFATPLSALGQR